MSNYAKTRFCHSFWIQKKNTTDSNQGIDTMMGLVPNADWSLMSYVRNIRHIIYQTNKGKTLRDLVEALWHLLVKRGTKCPETKWERFRKWKFRTVGIYYRVGHFITLKSQRVLKYRESLNINYNSLSALINAGRKVNARKHDTARMHNSC